MTMTLHSVGTDASCTSSPFLSEAEFDSLRALHRERVELKSTTSNLIKYL